MISVIVITRNSAKYLTRCLESILNQGIADLEIVAIDGNSTDGTQQILENAEKTTVFVQSGTGIANARNQGLTQSKGDLIAFLDSDDFWSPSKLESQRQCLFENPELLMVTGYLIKDISGRKGSEKYVALTPSGVLFRREIFQRYGCFSEKYQIASDHEMFFRLKKSGVKYRVLDRVVMTKTIHQHNLSHKRALYRKEMMNILRENSKCESPT